MTEMKIVEVLTRRRKELGLSLREVGKRAEIAHSSIYYYEKGEKEPTLSMLYRWGRALNYKLEISVEAND